MSAAIVRKALEIVDPDFSQQKGKKRKPKSQSSSLFPEKYKIAKTAVNIDRNTLPNRYTVNDAKRELNSEKDILEENLKKLELIKKHSKITLDQRSTNNIIQRAVSRRPIKTKRKKSKKSGTAFTEEDFKRFEEEYINTED